MRLSILLTGLWLVFIGLSTLGWVTFPVWLLGGLAIVAGILLILDSFYAVTIPVRRSTTPAVQ